MATNPKIFLRWTYNESEASARAVRKDTLAREDTNKSG